MNEVRVEDYFGEDKNVYYNPKMLCRIIEDITGLTLDAIKEEIDRQAIKVNKEIIESFLEKKFDEDKHDVKMRIENRGPRQDKNLDEMTLDDALEDSKRLSDAVVAYNYRYEPYTLEYFMRFVAILKQKLNALTDLIEKISNGNILEIKSTLDDLDIELDSKGNILDVDIVRLITPLIHNCNMLFEKIRQANNLKTYLNKITIESYFNGNTQPYPTVALQVKNIYANNDLGNIQLTQKQIEQIMQNDEEKNTIYSR